MSWQASVFAILALVLVGGIAWYERSRPSARMVALVAALAALAVAGRLVLAPIPNVVATTDVALITGYALGGAPGFAVGALAAPVSNIWLGQGPWTPWQMAGWGLVGLGGAWLAAVSGRRLGRLGLACACALAGFAYGALLDFSVMVGYGGEQSLDRYLALSARGLPFNVAHAAGNFALAYAAAPAMVRMISRYRDRLGFVWRPAGALPLALLTVAGVWLVAGGAPGGGAAARADEADRLAARGTAASARRYLERAQNRDGGYGYAPGVRSSVVMTGWAMLGLEAAGRNPLDVRSHGTSPVDYLRRNSERLRSPGDLERTILALAGAGVSPHSFAGRDLAAELRRRRDGNGSWDGQVNLTAYGVVAMRAAGSPGSALRRSREWLADARNGDGGWGFRAGQGSDPDSTGAALQGIAAAGDASGAGVGYLRGTQRREGGWGINETGVTNAQSTAWAVQGLVAAKVSPESVTSGGSSGIDYLRRRQAADGHYAYSSSSHQTPVWVTSQALLAVEREALPVGAVPRASQPGGLAVPVAGTAAAGEAARDGGGSRADGGSRSAASRKDEDAQGDRRRGDPGEAPVATDLAASDAEPADDGGGDPLPFVAGGMALLAAALGAGFLWYRNRLP